MIVAAIYHAGKNIQRIYYAGEIIFQGTVAEPVVFHSLEDGKLIILGVYSTYNTSNGLYLDCTE